MAGNIQFPAVFFPETSAAPLESDRQIMGRSHRDIPAGALTFPHDKGLFVLSPFKDSQSSKHFAGEIFGFAAAALFCVLSRNTAAAGRRAAPQTPAVHPDDAAAVAPALPSQIAGISFHPP